MSDEATALPAVRHRYAPPVARDGPFCLRCWSAARVRSARRRLAWAAWRGDSATEAMAWLLVAVGVIPGGLVLGAMLWWGWVALGAWVLGGGIP